MAFSSPAGSQPPELANGVIAPRHYRPPTSRELRAQALHRLQIGVLGLASMLLLVSLANIIMDRARESGEAVAGALSPAPSSVAPTAAVEKQAGDPLADIGVVPDLPANEAVPADAGLPSGAAPMTAPSP